MMRLRLVLIFSFVGTIYVTICGTLLAQSAPATTEDLMKQVLAAFAAKDQAALERLAVTQAEFKKYMWPGMATSGSNAEKSWDMFQKTSAVGVTSNLGEFGGKRLES
jgi:hypothetical protein